MLAIHLPADIERRLIAFAKRADRTKTFYAREAILRHLEDLEDAHLTVERLEQPAKRWAQEALEQDLDWKLA